VGVEAQRDGIVRYFCGDERLIKLIVHGIGHEGAADLIKERCTMLEIVDEKSNSADAVKQ